MIQKIISMSHINIPYEDLKAVNLSYSDDLAQLAKETIESGWYILGNKVKTFEEQFAKENAIEYCLGVASGLDALILGLSVFDFPKGSKVLVPSNTYIASILAILRSDLIPVLVEPNEQTYNLDLKGLSEKYKEDCVAVLVVHLYGRMCPMPEIVSFASEKGMKVVEDCAQSHFASINGIHAGCYGDIGAFSFYPTKNLGALGDAGAIICKDKSIYDKLLALRNYGSEIKYYNQYVGWNSRLDEIQASFLSLKLKKYKEVIEHKRMLASLYRTHLGGIKELKLPVLRNEDEHVWHIFNILTSRRDELKEYLKENGIGTEIHYPVAPINQVGYRSFFKNDKTPIAVEIHQQTLSLPISTCHSKDDIEVVCQKIGAFFN